MAFPNSHHIGVEEAEEGIEGEAAQDRDGCKLAAQDIIA